MKTKQIIRIYRNKILEFCLFYSMNEIFIGLKEHGLMMIASKCVVCNKPSEYFDRFSKLFCKCLMLL